MCRGDTFTGEELRGLVTHPVLAPFLARLVLIGEGIAGYPIEGGRGLRDHAGRVEPIKADESLRIAHPHDLLGMGDWHTGKSIASARSESSRSSRCFASSTCSPRPSGPKGRSPADTPDTRSSRGRPWLPGTRLDQPSRGRGPVDLHEPA